MSLRKFEILEMIAKGGMAEVYRARTVGLEGFAKELCVKKILPHLTEDQSFVGMFVNEAKLAATLSYANIVSVHDLCVSADREYFIVMEYVHGKDLSDIIRAAQLAGTEIPPAIATFIAREAAKGLHYAHTKTDAEGAPLNIIHRDVSPQNILCSFMGEVKLTDFGIAKATSISNKTAVGILKGKYGYMSPEQARGLPLDHRSDIFNMGIVLYEMLVGERCFAGASDYSTLNLMREAVVTPPSRINKNVPAALEQIVLRALSREATARYADALELEGALAAYARQSGEVAGATDLARFLKALFEAKPEDKPGRSTGVLNLSSVVAPAPEPPKPEPPKPEPPPEPAKVEPPKAAPKPEKPEPKPERAPKPEPPDEEKDQKAAAREEAIKNRRPVGRKDLKPGLTDLSALRGAGWRSKALKAGAVVLAAAAAGALLGALRGSGDGEQAVLREMELRGRPTKAGPEVVAISVRTTPPGATIVLDGQRLAEPTPTTVERERDDKAHSLRLELDGHLGLEKELRLAAGPVTTIAERLSPIPGRLAVRSEPSGLTVYVDGKELGATPLTAEVPSGKVRVEVGSARTERMVYHVELAPGGEAELEARVPAAGQRTTLGVKSARGVELLLDGRPTGRMSNEGVLELTPGVLHRVTLVDPARGVERAIEVRLQAGEQRQVFVDLDAS